MVAYMVADVEITDQERFQEYRAEAAPVLALHGGKVIAGGTHDHLEGDWHPKGLFVLEFPDLAAARRFYFSKEYQAALQKRLLSARSRLMLVDGM